MRHVTWIALVSVLLLAGCSDDTSAPKKDGKTGGEAGLDAGGDSGAIGNDVKPTKYVGGGTGGGSIDGRLNVYVLDGADDKPLEAAFVMLDDGSTDKGVTDKDGLITFRRAGLKGPVTLTAGLAGYTTGAVIGLDAANITLNLESRTPPKVETATVSGKIKDWDKLPPLITNHFRLGYVGYLFDEDLGSARNEVQQPPGDLNLYAPDPPLQKTSWAVTVPAGELGIFALVLDVDTKGTPSDKDDTKTLTHVGVLTGLKVGSGQTLADVEVPLTLADDKITVKLPAKPSGTDNVAVALIIQLASKELVPMFFSEVGQTEFPVPKLNGDFAGGNYWTIVAAEPAGEPEGDRQTETLAINRGLTDTSKPVDVTLLDLPTKVKLEGRKISFSVPSGTHLQGAKLYPESVGQPFWGVTFIGADTDLSYTLPKLPAGTKAEQPPAGKLFLHVNAIDAPGIDFNNVKFEDLGDKMLRSTQSGLAVELK
jgi:hypothetical protein